MAASSLTASSRESVRVHTRALLSGGHEIPESYDRFLAETASGVSFAERTVQAALVDRLTKPDLGWRLVRR